MSAAKHHDPRMRGFRERATVESVLALIAGREHSLVHERISLLEASGRILTETVIAARPVPGFDRAAMDGYALRGEETLGAGPYSPIAFRVAGRSRPGLGHAGTVAPGEAIEIATGAPIPSGADTVVPVEATARLGERVEVTEAFPVGRHVGLAGEDVAAGAVVFTAGRWLRPQDLGVLSGLGIAEVEAVKRPRVGILITGDELLEAGATPEGARFADMNSPMLRALVTRDGGEPTVIGPTGDCRETIRAALVEMASGYDVVMVSGGSSTGPEDHAPSLVAELGELPVHGVALRPASPTGLGYIGEVPVYLLPGNPVSCLCAYDLFAGGDIRRRGGRPSSLPHAVVERPLSRKLVSAIGRVDYARVRLVNDCVEPIAVSGASILSSTTRADGFVLVPADLEGYPEGASVAVRLYDPW